MDNEISILIADDHPIFRRGLRMVVESEAAFKVIGEADDGRAAMQMIEESEPDIAILDVDMPLVDGLAVARTIQEKNLPTQAIFLTMHRDEAIFNAAIDADVKGFVIKDSTATDVIICIKTVMKGRRFFSSILSEFLLNRSEKPKSMLDGLTVSERRILRLIAGGKTTKEISDELFVSPRTIEHHRAHICSKLDLTGKNALLTYALSNRDRIQSDFGF